MEIIADIVKHSTRFQLMNSILSKQGNTLNLDVDDGADGRGTALAAAGIGEYHTA